MVLSSSNYLCFSLSTSYKQKILRSAKQVLKHLPYNAQIFPQWLLSCNHSQRNPGVPLI